MNRKKYISSFRLSALDNPLGDEIGKCMLQVEETEGANDIHFKCYIPNAINPKMVVNISLTGEYFPEKQGEKPPVNTNYIFIQAKKWLKEKPVSLSYLSELFETNQEWVKEWWYNENPEFEIDYDDYYSVN